MTVPAPHFADRMASAVQRCGNAVVVGLDPRRESLPDGLLDLDRQDDPQAIANSYHEFCQGVIDVVSDLVPAVKPQMAFFEQLGVCGLQVLAEVVRYAQEKRLLVVMDGKRGDIGSTATAYAQAYVGPSASTWQSDALTVNPYLGDDSLTPFVEQANSQSGGIFVLVKTSNPGGRLFQDLIADGQPVYMHVAKYVQSIASETLGSCGYGSVGAVVGATYPEELAELRRTMPQTWLLVPGFGSQGGTAAEVAAAFDQRGLGAIINSSRGIIFAHARDEYRDRFGSQHWQRAVEAATRDMIDQLRTHTPCGLLSI